MVRGSLPVKIDARKPLLDAKMKAGVETSKLKWQMREKLGKASKKE